ncbi:hypothetical protein ACPRNU_22495 [Chromobacterium vaccinii]|uniref:hypothetical protein n=1 Tax=Chromobacterium vaccinii TaxID=1108595 RepID=UPI003C778B0C
MILPSKNLVIVCLLGIAANYLWSTIDKSSADNFGWIVVGALTFMVGVAVTILENQDDGL